MKLRDILGLLESNCIIELRKDLNYIENLESLEQRLICITRSDSEGVNPYLDRHVIGWGVPKLSENRTIAELYFILQEE